jgi:NitT/TauT family transport system substrate-binding protein
MKRHRWKTAAASVLALSLVATACGDDDEDAAPVTEAPGDAGTTPPAVTAAPGVIDDTTAPGTTVPCESPIAVKLQLQWFVQAQFGGYFAAVDQGFYDAYCLDVEILEGGVDIVPQQQLADGAADFAIAWVPKALQTREAGADIVNIAQIFQRSGTLQVSFADAGIVSRSSPRSPRPGSIRRPTSSSCSSSSTCSACWRATSTPPRR